MKNTHIILSAVIVLILMPFSKAQNANIQINPSAPWNTCVLRAIELMPEGGGYATNLAALDGLSKAVQINKNVLEVDAKSATPSFCSGATYLVFTKVIEQLSKQHIIRFSDDEPQRMKVNRQADGVGVWGRWNANGPGVAILFHETGLGLNFESFDEALPGDFMKIFWTDQIGAKEFGHVVVYLGKRTDANGTTVVKFWSSNQPGGYSAKEVPMSKIHWAIFSRMLKPTQISALPVLASIDQTSQKMLKRSFTQAEVRILVGMTTPKDFNPATLPRVKIMPTPTPQGENMKRSSN